MPEWSALPLIVIAGLLPGWFIYLHLRGQQDGPPALLERLLAALALGLAVVGWLAFFLAEIGLFSLTLLGSTWGILLLVLGATAHRRGLLSRGPTAAGPDGDAGAHLLPFVRLSPPPWLEVVILGLWLIAAAWLFLRPHQYFLGGSDAGVYVNTAAYIAEEGQILIEEQTLAELDPALYPSLLRERRAGEGTTYYLFPGFNVSDEEPGTIIPDFFHLHPVWQAVAYALGGLGAALLLPGLWALLSSLSVYLVVRQIAGWPVALLALAGLTFNALQVWFARYPVTESLTQYLLWTGLWALGAWLNGRTPRSLWGLLAGLALGQVLLVRIDTLFLLALPFLVAIWLLLSGRWQRSALWFFLPFAILTGHAILHAALISTPYAYRIAYYVLFMLRRFWLIPLFLVLIGSILLLLLLRYRHIFPRLWQRRVLLLGMAASAILLLGLYGWFLRPVLGQTSSYVDWYGGQTILLTDHENLPRLGWYLSPVGVWLGILGTAWLLWRLNSKTALVVGVGLFFSLLYLWRIQATPHHIYAMRRYVPVALPFFMLATACLLGFLGRQRALGVRLLVLALALLWLGGLAWSAQGFITQVDNQQLPAEVAAFEAHFDENAVVIFNDQTPVSLGDLLGTPLHYRYGHDVFTLRVPDALNGPALRRQIERWQAAGREVYWVGPTDPLANHEITWTGEQTDTITFEHLENSYDHKPVRLIPARWVLSLARIK